MKALIRRWLISLDINRSLLVRKAIRKAGYVRRAR